MIPEKQLKSSCTPSGCVTNGIQTEDEEKVLPTGVEILLNKIVPS